MALSKISLKNFRCFSSLNIDLSPGTNFFYGKNGSGKTSILEAIYLCSSGSSFKSSNIQSLISHSKNAFDIAGYDESSGYILNITKNRIQPISISLNNSKATRADLTKEFPCMAIHNNTYSFASASPDFRRKLLDRSLFICEHEFYEAWFSFYRALKQRNALLKSNMLQELEAWNEKFCTLGKNLTNLRNVFFRSTLSELKILLEKIYELTNNNILNKISFDFYQGWPIDKSLEDSLDAVYRKDLVRRTSAVGPHKADIRLLIEGLDARQILSRGEQKLLSIMWCCAQNEVLKKKYNLSPTLLIDDIKSELDSLSFDSFLSVLNDLNNQIIFSCIDDLFSSKIRTNIKKFHVEQFK